MKTYPVTANLLIVEDSADNIGLLYEILSSHGYAVSVAEDGEAALEFLRSDEEPDLILLDVMMPGIDGFETCRRLKANPVTADIPVIFMTALQEPSEKAKGLALGAVDYITKPIEETELLARLQTHLKLHSLQQQLRYKSTQLEANNAYLQKSLREQRALIDNSLVGIAFVDANRRLVDMNRQLAEIFGYRRDELLGQTTRVWYPSEEDYEQLGTEAYPILNQGETYETERLMVRKDGSRFWGRLRGRAINPGELAQGFVWNLDDVSARKHAEDELRLAAKVFGSIQEGVMVTDTSATILAVNPAFCALSGYRAEELTGQTPRVLRSSRHEAEFYKHMWNTLLRDDCWQGKVYNRRKDGSEYRTCLTIKTVRRPDRWISHYVGLYAMPGGREIAPQNFVPTLQSADMEDTHGNHEEIAPARFVPSMHETAPRPADSSGESAGKPIPHARLLYVEDDELDALLVQGVLESEGYQVDIAEDGATALAVMDKGYYALLLVDYQLPDMSGLDLLQRLRSRNSRLPVILVTAEESVGVAVTAIKRGAMDYLRKDADLAGLLPSVVERTLESCQIHAIRDEAREAKAQQALYSSIFDSAFVAFFILTPDGRIVTVNDTACKISGYSHDDLVRLHMKTLLHPDAYTLFDDFLDASKPFPLIDAQIMSKEGALVEIEIQRSEINYHDTLHLLAMVRDISGRKQAEERLRQAAIVFEHSPEAVMITDTEERIIAVNRAFSEITGYPETEVLGITPRLLRSGRHDNAFYAAMWSRLQATGVWQGEIWNRRKNGELFPAWQDISVVPDAEGKPHRYIGLFSDLTERKLTEEKIRKLVHYDLLTGLPNRLLFSEQLQNALGRAHHHHRRVVVLYLGLDRFKQANDSFGHLLGDRLLKRAARRLTRLTEQENTARMSGDEFSLFQEISGDVEEAAKLAARVLTEFSKVFEIDEHHLHLSASVGISVYPQDGDSVANMIRHANTAMTRAKQQGGNNYQFYAASLTLDVKRRLALENALRRALERDDELFLEYQPQLDLQTGKLTGAEALARWQHPELGLISPVRFIPLAEDTGLIVPLGEWVLRTACRQMQLWQQNQCFTAKVSVNLSGLQLLRSDMVTTVHKVLAETGLDPSHLELEVTESLFIHDLEYAVGVLEELRGLGVSLALDDFGTGYSSLTYLQKLPMDKLKLDGGFLRNLQSGQDKGEIAVAVIALGRSLNLCVICEGVETPEQESFLKQHGCHEAQGFLSSKPLPVARFEAFALQNPA